MTTYPSSSPNNSLKSEGTQSDHQYPSSSSQQSTSSPDTHASMSDAKKISRTNYNPEQVQALDKEFRDNPYPDSEKMERISKEIGVPEGKIKVRLNCYLNVNYIFVYNRLIFFATCGLYNLTDIAVIIHILLCHVHYTI